MQPKLGIPKIHAAQVRDTKVTYSPSKGYQSYKQPKLGIPKLHAAQVRDTKVTYSPSKGYQSYMQPN